MSGLPIRREGYPRGFAPLPPALVAGALRRVAAEGLENAGEAPILCFVDGTGPLSQPVEGTAGSLAPPLVG